MTLLSAFIRCHRDPGVVQQVARLLRPSVDELLIVADAAMTADDLRVLAAARPDRLLRIPWMAPSERANAWIHGECSGRWVLRLDGDEIPGTRLLEGLRSLVEDDRFTHYLLPRAWTWPDVRHRLDQSPWWPDHQQRLVRNDPALTHFPATIHTCAEVIGPARLLEWPLVHLDLALAPLASRREKVRSYESIRPGVTLRERPMNEAIYLPEAYDPAPLTCSLDPGDAELVERVLAGAASPDRRRARVAYAPSPEEIDAAAAGQRMPSSTSSVNRR